MVYKTRVKQYTSMPYFEAGTERFIRDWRETVVRVQVRDARLVCYTQHLPFILTVKCRVREKDPVLGIVTVKLSELFKNSSGIARLFSIQEGIGESREIAWLFAEHIHDLLLSFS